MTRDETKQAIKILFTAYPHYYRDATEESLRDTVDLYWGMLEEYPAEAVGVALRKYIKTNKYPPTIAGIVEIIELADDKTDYEAMYKEARRAISGNVKWSDLSEVNRKYFGSKTMLEAYGLDEGFNEEVFRGQYMARVKEIGKRIEVKQEMTNVRTLADTLRGHKREDELPDVKIGELVEDINGK